MADEDVNAAKSFPPPADLVARSHLPSRERYEALYRESLEQPEVFWTRFSRETLTWNVPFRTVRAGGFDRADMAWFPDGQLNACYNAVDRHAYAHPNRVAFIWEQDEPGHAVKITYRDLLGRVAQCANYLRYELHVQPGDVVTIYLPMIPEAVVSMLACARIGAVHNVVFAGFSSEALADRLSDARSRILITSDHGKRGGKLVHTKQLAAAAVRACGSLVQKVLVVRHTGVPLEDSALDLERDIWWHETVAQQRSSASFVSVGAEDPLFMLYTSGSTGTPKGVIHTTAGYLLQTALSFKYAFDYHEDDVYACVADVGWITGHSYLVYGPLLNGATGVLFESTPMYPEPDRYWRLVAEHKVTILYTSPTAVRSLRKMGDAFVEKHDLSSLRIIGSVGEPINPEAWHWLYETVGKQRAVIVDTYWQTETGSFVMCPLPGAVAAKPGAAALPMFGFDVAVLDPETGKELLGNNVAGVLAIRSPWPSIARSVHKNFDRYISSYLAPYPGFYFSGDGVLRDKDGYYWIRGRVDDVMNVSGHRISTAEIENALIQHRRVAESAVVGIQDDVTGQAICCFVVARSAVDPEPTSPLVTAVRSLASVLDVGSAAAPGLTADQEKALIGELRQLVRSSIGPFATPKKIVIVPELPKTRSGKIVRRLLRKIGGGDVTGEETPEQQAAILGDLSTLADPQIVPLLVAKARG